MMEIESKLCRNAKSCHYIFVKVPLRHVKVKQDLVLGVLKSSALAPQYPIRAEASSVWPVA